MYVGTGAHQSITTNKCQHWTLVLTIAASIPWSDTPKPKVVYTTRLSLLTVRYIAKILMQGLQQDVNPAPYTYKQNLASWVNAPTWRRAVGCSIRQADAPSLAIKNWARRCWEWRGTVHRQSFAGDIVIVWCPAQLSLLITTHNIWGRQGLNCSTIIVLITSCCICMVWQAIDVLILHYHWLSSLSRRWHLWHCGRRWQEWWQIWRFFSMWVDMHSKKTCSSSQMYSLKVEPFHYPIFWICWSE